MVHADAHSGMVLLTDIDKRYEFRLDFLQLLSIFLVSIFQMLEGASWVDIVTGIDTYLLTVLCSDIGRMGGKVHVSH